MPRALRRHEPRERLGDGQVGVQARRDRDVVRLHGRVRERIHVLLQTRYPGIMKIEYGVGVL